MDRLIPPIVPAPLRALICLLVIGLLLLFMGSPLAVSAEDDDAPVEIGNVPTATIAAPTATSVPPTATAAPPTATSVPPTATMPPSTSTSIPPTATIVPTGTTTAPATGTASPTLAPTATGTTTGTATATSSNTPTATITPTATPSPAARLVYALDEHPECRVDPEQESAIASGESVDYVCRDTVDVSGTNAVPDDVSVTWAIDVAASDGWSVQLLPPDDDPTDDEEPEWTPEQAPSASFIFDQPAPLGTGIEAQAIDASPAISFRLRIHRPACSTDASNIQLTHDVAVLSASTGTEVADESLTREPLRVMPKLAPLPEPSIAFDGPLDFGSIGVTATGPTTSTSTGTLALTVTGLDQTCGSWLPHVTADPLTDPTGEPLKGSSLVAVSINGESLPDDGCDLTAGCALRTLTGGPDAPSSQSITVEVELRMPEMPHPGAFSTSLTATLDPAGDELASTGDQPTGAGGGKEGGEEG